MDSYVRIEQLVVLSPACLSHCLRNFNRPTSEFQVNQSLNFFISQIFDQKHVESRNLFQFLTMLKFCMFSLQFHALL